MMVESAQHHTAQRGMSVMTWSFYGLCATALLQAVVVFYTGSVALLADTIHNVADAVTAIPLWVAFALARMKPTTRFTYGYGRVEDLVGLFIVAVIFFSAIVAGYAAINRFLHPEPLSYLWAVMAAAIIGFLGNEAVAIYRHRVGKEIGSAALIAEAHHAHVDGLTSLAVLGGAIGVWLGYPLADPIVGLLIAVVIFRIVWKSAREVLTRLLDGIDPSVVDEITHAIGHVEGVREISEVRVRWSGHRMLAEINLAVDPGLSVEAAHEIASEVRHQLLHHLKYLSNATIHIDPTSVSGEHHHQIGEHEHDDYTVHSH